jgi:tellurite resistance protein TehA-like permease
VKIPPASWTIVMSTGVVSLDLRTVHQPVLSAILLWFAAAVWLLLVVVLAAPLAYQRGRFAREARHWATPPSGSPSSSASPYDVRRWATVFPLGMYAACSFTVGQVAGVSAIVTFARVETWIALAVTLIVAAAQIRSLARRP